MRRQRTLVTELDDLAPTLSGIAGWQGVGSELDALLARRALAEKLNAALPTLADTPEQLLALRQAAARRLQHPEDQPEDTTLAPASHAFAQALAAAEAARQAFAEQAGLAEDTPAADLVRTAAALLRQPGRLKAWCDWQRVREEAEALGLAPLIARVTVGSAEDLAAVFETAYARWFAATALDAEPLLRDFVPAEHESDIQAYRRLDDRLQQLAVRHIRARLCGELPPKNDAARQGGGFAVLKHELQKQRRHKPLRQLALEMGDALARLAPCMLMSPLSIAQYLPPDGGLFDLVIFDEASQIAPWDAVGAIARGVQVVIAGDPRQMPPTRFFDRAAGEDDTAEDLESILDECLGAGIYSHSLNWHYRSRHESLIAFSNHHYYDGKLITFPAPEIRPSAVEWRRVDGVYAKGKGRHNALEAQAMVAEAVKRLLDPAFAGLSLGIITLNSEQQRLVTDLLDRARQQHPEIEAHFAEDLPEPVVVKNLETVQGDERDLIMLRHRLRSHRTGCQYHVDELRPAEQGRRLAPPQRRRDPGAARDAGVLLLRSGADRPQSHQCPGGTGSQAVPGIRPARSPGPGRRGKGLPGRPRFALRGSSGPGAAGQGLAGGAADRCVAFPHRPGHRPSRPAGRLPGRHRMRRRHLPQRRHRPRPRQDPQRHPPGSRLDAAARLVHRVVDRPRRGYRAAARGDRETAGGLAGGGLR
ncbi:hypothetical protein Q3H58_001516 [Pseudomonas psychrotolerans]|nr:hypothetical protein [Pseudomonas psychrotolerans]